MPPRRVWVGDVSPYSQHSHSVSVAIWKTRRRRTSCYTICNDDLQYLTVEAGGRVLFESRPHVPCDKVKWEATRQRFKHCPPVQTTGG
jgi:hypothetical protein